MKNDVTLYFYLNSTYYQIAEYDYDQQLFQAADRFTVGIPDNPVLLSDISISVGAFYLSCSDSSGQIAALLSDRLKSCLHEELDSDFAALQPEICVSLDASLQKLFTGAFGQGMIVSGFAWKHSEKITYQTEVHEDKIDFIFNGYCFSAHCSILQKSDAMEQTVSFLSIVDALGQLDSRLALPQFHSYHHRMGALMTSFFSSSNTFDLAGFFDFLHKILFDQAGCSKLVFFKYGVQTHSFQEYLSGDENGLQSIARPLHNTFENEIFLNSLKNKKISRISAASLVQKELSFLSDLSPSFILAPIYVEDKPWGVGLFDFEQEPSQQEFYALVESFSLAIQLLEFLMKARINLFFNDLIDVENSIMKAFQGTESIKQICNKVSDLLKEALPDFLFLFEASDSDLYRILNKKMFEKQGAEDTGGFLVRSKEKFYLKDSMVLSLDRAYDYLLIILLESNHIVFLEFIRRIREVFYHFCQRCFFHLRDLPLTEPVFWMNRFTEYGMVVDNKGLIHASTPNLSEIIDLTPEPGYRYAQIRSYVWEADLEIFNGLFTKLLEKRKNQNSIIHLFASRELKICEIELQFCSFELADHYIMVTLRDISMHEKRMKSELYQERMNALSSFSASVIHQFSNIFAILKGYYQALPEDSINQAGLSSQSIESTLVRAEDLLKKMSLFVPEGDVPDKSHYRYFDLNVFVMEFLSFFTMAYDGIHTALGEQMPKVYADYLALKDVYICVLDLFINESGNVKDVSIFSSYDRELSVILLEIHYRPRRFVEHEMAELYNKVLNDQSPSWLTCRPFYDVDPRLEVIVHLPVSSQTEGVCVEVVPREQIQKMLIVDDEKYIRQMLKEVFENYFEIETARNGKEAFDKAMNGNFDVILLDVIMPVMSGEEFLIEFEPFRTSERICIITGFTDSFDVAHSKSRYDISFVVKKPFNIQALRSKVLDLFS